LDIDCIQISARRLPEGNALITSRQLLPLPAAEDYLVKRRRREKEEERWEASERRPNVVAELLTADAIEPGSELSLKLDSFSREEQNLIRPNLQKDPLIGRAEWTGISLHKALRWHLNNEYYTATGLVKKILQEYGPRTKRVPEPQYWTVPDGRTLLEVADGLTEEPLDEIPLNELVE
jgi:hypothetical protein